MRRSPSHGRPPGTRSKIPDTVRADVAARSGGRCEAQHPGCTIRATEMHHRLMRSAGGKHTVENLLDLCTAGHRYIHGHPNWSYEQGYLLKRSS